MVGRDAELKDHRVALGRGPGRGFGRVSIPADNNPADDAYWFAFDKPAPRRTVVVGEDPEAARPLALAAAIAPDPAVACSAEVVEPGALTGVDWDRDLAPPLAGAAADRRGGAAGEDLPRPWRAGRLLPAEGPGRRRLPRRPLG